MTNRGAEVALLMEPGIQETQILLIGTTVLSGLTVDVAVMALGDVHLIVANGSAIMYAMNVKLMVEKYRVNLSFVTKLNVSYMIRVFVIAMGHGIALPRMENGSVPINA